VAHALVDCIFEHEEKCSRCRELGRTCERIGDVLDMAVQFAEARMLRSKAEALRRRHIFAALAPLSERRAACPLPRNLHVATSSFRHSRR
jgi:hypothetical protein